jgi:rod shape-determining protein MreD
MSRIAGSSAEVAMRDVRRRFVPIATTIFASALSLLPIVASAPILPDFGFLVLLTWRLLRPEIWPAHVALGLGLVNDLLSGNPLGQSMALWTALFLLLDLLERSIGFRDYWIDWLFASLAIILHTAGVWYVARLMGSETSILIMAPQLALSILIYPLIARIVLGLDRWRLSR